MSAGDNVARLDPKRTRTHHRWTWRSVAVMGFAVAVLVLAGLGFVYKMTEFAATIVKHDIEGFGAVALSVYLIGMIPLLFLTLWAILTGRFRDIERPKYRMLEMDREIDAAEAAAAGGRDAR